MIKLWKMKNTENKKEIDKLWNFLKNGLVRLGQKPIYMALLLYYAYKRKDTPIWAKNIIIGALGYLLAPFDALPDLTPILGFTDDIGVLSFGLVTIACYVNAEVRELAQAKMSKVFDNLDDKVISEVDMMI